MASVVSDEGGEKRMVNCCGSGKIRCHCGGDLCVCGMGESDCPGCEYCEFFDDQHSDPSGHKYKGSTEGPWSVDIFTGYEVWDKHQRIIADCYHKHSVKEEEARENARLIADAPKRLHQRDLLLAALRKIADYGEGKSNVVALIESRNIARAAIEEVEKNG